MGDNLGEKDPSLRVQKGKEHRERHAKERRKKLEKEEKRKKHKKQKRRKKEEKEKYSKGLRTSRPCYASCIEEGSKEAE